MVSRLPREPLPKGEFKHRYTTGVSTAECPHPIVGVLMLYASRFVGNLLCQAASGSPSFKSRRAVEFAALVVHLQATAEVRLRDKAQYL